MGREMAAAAAAEEEEEEGLLPLFETKEAKGRASYRLFAATIFVGICLILVYRIVSLSRTEEKGRGRWVWIGMFMAEVLFSLSWIITQSVRWNVVSRFPYKNRLHQSYDYPPEKLNVYLSDDAGSEFTFYALLEASHFSKDWIPFCKRFNIEPRSPEAYFLQKFDVTDAIQAQERLAIKKKYEEMKNRIESAIAKGSISLEIRNQHKGFSEWNSQTTKQDHQSIVQIIINGKEAEVVDIEGCQLPTLVYMAREKRPGWPHNFKAGAMNALIRVSSEISNGSIILNLDCDMYANDAGAIRDALCFFMDEKRGHEIAFVQHPQRFHNINKTDLYADHNHVVNKVELAGMDGYDASPYCGTGCFHRRESLSGAKYCKDNRGNSWDNGAKKNDKRSDDELEKTSKFLASCSYDQNTQWGKEMGLIYDCAVEDLVTGLAIQCRGWKSIYYYPERAAFLGVASTALDIALIQYKRWSEGMFQIFLSKYCPFIWGHGKIKFGAQMGYCNFFLWAPFSFPTLFYVFVPPLCLLHGISLFPKISSLWFIPFAYVFITKNVYNMLEELSCGTTLKGWWNRKRMLTIRKTTAFFLAFIDVLIKQLGFSQTAFAITAKVATEDVSSRYEQEIMEFGSSSIMFTIVSTLAMLNLFSLAGGIIRIIFLDFGALAYLFSQVILCGLMVLVNLPIYEALFIRKGQRLPTLFCHVQVYCFSFIGMSNAYI